MKTVLSSSLIHAEAHTLGFDLVGCVSLEAVADEEVVRYRQWLTDGKHASMSYLERYPDLRRDPRLLVENARSMVCVALNYFPGEVQPSSLPQLSYYAYGDDYHEVMRHKLEALLQQLRKAMPHLQGRSFVDTAPLMERYWASQAGLGWIGRNRQLISPTHGSYLFLGELLLTATIDEATPVRIDHRCGQCRRCIESCPANALSETGGLDARRCLSYRTIEHRGSFDELEPADQGNRLMGCDECQKVCPWNRFAHPSSHSEFTLRPAYRRLTSQQIEQMSQEEFSRLFAHSPVKRIKLEGLKRNCRQLENRNGTQ